MSLDAAMKSLLEPLEENINILKQSLADIENSITRGAGAPPTTLTNQSPYDRLKVVEVAKLQGVSETTLRRYMAEGKSPPHFKDGKTTFFLRKDVWEFNEKMAKAQRKNNKYKPITNETFGNRVTREQLREALESAL